MAKNLKSFAAIARSNSIGLWVAVIVQLQWQLQPLFREASIGRGEVKNGHAAFLTAENKLSATLPKAQ